ncbi:reverse transcriptase/maturase family protein [Staphylospora marina]|uniref:reverse transcriptase/maturase family protein n=1 Tax=Staphylospora marina TaxID=2490858 RepID=UPI0013DE20AC|nr:reverse transcriptase/maturase family protein [Staphylospora marina]
MRNPKAVLNSLARKAKDDRYKFRRLYRNFYNEEFFWLALNRLSARKGVVDRTAGERGMDGTCAGKIRTIIEKLKDQTYQPVKVCATKVGTKHPPRSPAIDDLLVQEVCRMILEAIFEGSFSDESHGFRPGRSCHTALMHIRERFTGVRWFIQGNLGGVFENIDHQKLVEILKKRIEDERFVNLIRKFLRAGYLKDWRYHGTYSGTPQGGIIGPVLTNIFLDRLDKHVADIRERFEGSGFQPNPTGAGPTDGGNKRLRHVRYADRFLIGIIGSKADARRIREEIAAFARERLNVSLPEENLLITHSSEPVRFLAHDIVIPRPDVVPGGTSGTGARLDNMRCRLCVPKETWMNRLLQLKVLKIDEKGRWRAMHLPRLARLEDVEILNVYNAEIEGLYNYYRLADNVNVLRKFFYIMKYSMYKTFAGKYKTSVSRILGRYLRDGRFTVEYRTKSGMKRAVLYDRGFKRDTRVLPEEADLLPGGFSHKRMPGT